jgi:hypothetical protein
MSIDFSAREKECFNFLLQIPRNISYVVVGGYAVTAYGFPRFSVDLDITIPESEVPFFKELITENGFILSKTKEDLSYSGRFERYEKNLVSIDLLINGIESRQTGYFYSFDYIFKNSQLRETSGWDPANKVKARIAKKEMLLAMKIHSMRTTDKRDIIMLCYEEPNTKNILSHLKNSPKEKIIGHLDELLTLLNEKNLKDSLKGVYSISDSIYKKMILNCQRTMNDVKNQLL